MLEFMNPMLFSITPAVALAAREASMTLDCLKALVVLAIFLLPFYLLMRSLAKLTRIRYGFEPEPEDDGPPIRVCFECNNTVLEQDFSHCPYCGAALEAIDSEVSDETESDGDATPDA